MDTKFNLHNAFAWAPAADIRANLARNWSKVDFLPGPDNMLQAQTRVSGNLGFDYRFTMQPLTIGANFSFKTGGPVRLSLTQTTYTSARRNLDVYVLWKFTPTMQLRMTGSNLLAQDYLQIDRYVDATNA